MTISKFTLLTLISISISTAAPVIACDVCGCYLPPVEALPKRDLGIFAGVSEQFTHFGSVRVDGHKIDDPSGQYLDSSITQFVAGYSFLEQRFGFQVNVPYLYRSYRRPEGFETERGTESGLGDISLLAHFVVFQTSPTPPAAKSGFSKDGKSSVPMTTAEPNFSASLNLIAGVKLPTGDSSRIKEEFNEVEVEGAPESGIHGHDLTLGTGSYDGVIGLQLFTRYRAVFFQADTQFTLRGDGRHSYHFANELSWSGGPGVYLLRKGTDSLALQGVVSGETKDTDRFQGRAAEDTGITAVYLGPRVTASWGKVNAEVGVDLPVVMDNTALQATPDYRLRAGFSIHF